LIFWAFPFGPGFALQSFRAALASPRPSRKGFALQSLTRTAHIAMITSVIAGKPKLREEQLFRKRKNAEKNFQSQKTTIQRLMVG
jgi:hypothetical protein